MSTRTSEQSCPAHRGGASYFDAFGDGGRGRGATERERSRQFDASRIRKTEASRGMCENGKPVRSSFARVLRQTLTTSEEVRAELSQLCTIHKCDARVNTKKESVGGQSYK
jgi:hypothetical protein